MHLLSKFVCPSFVHVQCSHLVLGWEKNHCSEMNDSNLSIEHTCISIMRAYDQGHYVNLSFIKARKADNTQKYFILSISYWYLSVLLSDLSSHLAITQVSSVHAGRWIWMKQSQKEVKLDFKLSCWRPSEEEEEKVWTKFKHVSLLARWRWGV